MSEYRVGRRARKVKLVAASVLAVMLVAVVAVFAWFDVAGGLLRAGRSQRPGKDLSFLYSIPAPSQPALLDPTSVLLAPNGGVYVADSSAHQVRVYDQSGHQLFSFGKLQDGSATHLVAPVDMALYGDDGILVTDRTLRALYQFDLSGRFIRRFIRPDKDWSPIGVASDSDGFVYVTDVGNGARHRVRVFNPSGMEVLEFGRTAEVKAPSQSPGAFYYPDRVLPSGNSLFVADSNNGRVQVFDRNGDFKYEIPTGGVPRGIAFDNKGQLFVVDALGSSVDIYSSSEKVGELGADGDFRFPNDVSVDSQGRVYVADRGNSRVQVWGRVLPVSGVNPVRLRPAWLLLALPALAVPVLVLARPKPELDDDAEEAGR